MFDSQLTITGYTLWRIFPFQKEAVSHIEDIDSVMGLEQQDMENELSDIIKLIAKKERNL